MKKFIIKAISFVFLFVFIDFFSGLVFDTLKKKRKRREYLEQLSYYERMY